MNNTCANCGGFIGDFTWSGDGAKICNCRYQPQPDTDNQCNQAKKNQAIAFTEQLVRENPTPPQDLNKIEWAKREQLMKDVGVAEWKAEGRSEEALWGVKNFLTGLGGAKILRLIAQARQEGENQLKELLYHAIYANHNPVQNCDCEICRVIRPILDKLKELK